jgi:hypothetical protein
MLRAACIATQPVGFADKLCTLSSMQSRQYQQALNSLLRFAYSDLFDSNGKPVGRGYLEITGYAGALQI